MRKQSVVLQEPPMGIEKPALPADSNPLFPSPRSGGAAGDGAAMKKKFMAELEVGAAGGSVNVCLDSMRMSSPTHARASRIHPKDITNVAFHRSYPLFASCSDDCTAYVFHGMVYSDLNQDPLLVPLEILRGHTTFNGRGVLDCKFHPRQPWLFTAGADSVIKLFCH